MKFILLSSQDCAKCGGHIGDKVVDFEDLQFHPECFICGKCSKILHGKTILEFLPSLGGNHDLSHTRHVHVHVAQGLMFSHTSRYND